MNEQVPADAPASGISPQQRQWAMFGHLSALLGFIIPLANLLAPLVIWQMKKEDMPFAAEQAKEALNFQITVTIAAIICGVLTVVLIGFLLLPLLGLAAVIFTIIAGIKANEGVAYRYPFTLRLIN